MESKDQLVVCSDCQSEFTFSSGEQEFFAQRGFQSPPRRCRPCREARRSRGSAGAGRRRSSPQEYRSPAFRASEPAKKEPKREPRVRRALPEGIEEYRAPSFAPRREYAPIGADEVIDEEADNIGNRLHPVGSTPKKARQQKEKPAHSIVCSECGQTSTVPFQPQAGRAVFCHDCFQTKRESGNVGSR